MKTKILIFVVACFFRCLLGDGETTSRQEAKDTGLPEKFVELFDDLFLSSKPLRYQDNTSLLDSVQLEKLRSEEQEILRTKLKEFLSYDNSGRGYTDDCYQTGVADPFAFLRLDCLIMLGKVGSKADVEFIQQLNKGRGSEHPLFVKECERVTEELRNR